jgi:RTX calcium-binding nonapeptide repeat (4 copies)
MSTSDEVKPWHHYAKEFKQALKTDDMDAFTRSLDEALGADHIIRDGDMLIDGNDHGRSYNCMGQSDMGLLLIRAGRQWGVTEWVDDGIAAMNVMLTDYDDGGLLLRDAETGTAWYCGQTARHHGDRGGTLNKHLYATRTFFRAAEEMEALGRPDQAEIYEAAGEEGYLKLVKGKQAPKLKDFFVEKEPGDVHLNSWAYYACGDADGDKSYFLKNNQKNASYHIYDMELIYKIGTLVDEGFDFRPFFREQLGSMSAFGGMLEVYLNKLERGGLEEDTPTKFGQFSSTTNGNGDTPDSDVIVWLDEFLQGLRINGTQGDDTLAGSELGKVVRGLRGEDTLLGDLRSDTLRGGRGKDTLMGGEGNDKLVGGRGPDRLEGEDGDDIFRFTRTRDSKPGAERDTIADFERSLDVVDLNAIDAREDRAGNQDFAFLGNAAFSGRSGELRFENGRLMADTDGDAVSDFEVALPGITNIGAADLML